jgi:hypothetical protein
MALSLHTLWSSYTAASSRSAANDMGLPPPGHAVIVGIDSARFFKLCKDGRLLDAKFRKADVDLVFTKFAKQRRLDYEAFQKVLSEIAVKKDADGEALVETLLRRTENGPSMHGTLAESTRLHDDKSTYTGVYKAGGPTTIDYEKQGMDKLCDRTKRATIRGVPELAVYGPGGINVLMAPSLPCSPFMHLPAGKSHSNSSSDEPHMNTGSGDDHNLRGSHEEKNDKDREDADPAYMNHDGEFSMGQFMASLTSANLKDALLPRKLAQLCKHLYVLYTAASSRSSANDMGLPPPPKPIAQGIDSARFLKLLKDGSMLDRHVRYSDVDVVFTKHAKGRRLNLQGFQSALLEIALKRQTDIGKILNMLYESSANGPTIRGSASEYTRLHDDKSTYTGVYKAGGPTTVDYEKQSMDQLCDRRKKATVRGTPNIMLNGPGDKFAIESAHKQALDSSREHFERRNRAHGYSGIVSGEDAARENQARAVSHTPESVLGKYYMNKRQVAMSPLPFASPAGGSARGGNGGGGGESEHATPQHHRSNIEYTDSMGVSHIVEGHDAGLSSEDMEITEEQLGATQEIYRQYELHSRSFKEQQQLKNDPDIDVYGGAGCGLDSSKFLKLCVDGHLFDRFYSRNDVDIVYMKHRASAAAGGAHAARKMNFECFQNALLEIAFKKGQRLGALIDHISFRTAGGPSNNHGTIAEANRFYDDKTLFTGVAARAGTVNSVFNSMHESSKGLEYEYDAGNSLHPGNIYASPDAVAAEAPATTEDIDMSVTGEQLECVRQLFTSFAASSKKSSGKGDGGSSSEEPAVDSTRFAKLCVDGALFDDMFAREHVDIVFAKYKSQKASLKRRMDFEGFQRALLEIATKKKTPLGDMVDALVTSAISGPSLNGTMAEANRFHDDKSTYTSTSKNGGADFRVQKQGIF